MKNSHADEWVRQIKPCRQDGGYVFISYSSEDKEAVYQDVLEFQKQGYNIWLDEKNLDKTKDSWKKDALEAIQDSRCKLLAFYVSKNSLVSEACYDELHETTSERTKDMHEFKPLKFVAVEVERFDDILEYKVEIARGLYGKMDKEECAKRINTLKTFVEDFFNGNNERVRIHAKSEDGYDERYYTSIMESFPEETRIPSEARGSDATDPGEAGSPDGIKKPESGRPVSQPQEEGPKKEGKRASQDICYSIYGKQYKENQSAMMLRIFAEVLKRHPDRVAQLPGQAFMNCASQTDYTDKKNRTEEMPSYFRTCENFKFENGESVCIGTSYSLNEKLKKIAVLLQYCGE